MHPLRLLASILLGAAFAIAAAWGIAAAGPHVPQSADPQRLTDLPAIGTWRWYSTRHSGLGHALFIFRAANVTPEMRRPYELAGVVRASDFPAWVELPARGMYHEQHGFGWPMPCMGRRHVHARPKDFHLFGRSSNGVTIPLRPILPGLVVDALVGAVPAWMLLAVPINLARRRRRRRGRCAWCGYDLRGRRAVCPECGKGDAPQR